MVLGLKNGGTIERQFYINWQALVEETKKRRKRQQLTQAQLAKLAKVSTPTISQLLIGQDGTKKVICEISRETLEDSFNVERSGFLKTLKKSIRHRA